MALHQTLKNSLSSKKQSQHKDEVPQHSISEANTANQGQQEFLETR